MVQTVHGKHAALSQSRVAVCHASSPRPLDFFDLDFVSFKTELNKNDFDATQVQPDVVAKLHEQALKLSYYHTYVGHSNEPQIALSEKILELAGPDMSKVYYGMSGSDATQQDRLRSPQFQHSISCTLAHLARRA